jgi:polar amino acid transport system substrate-binding protein
MKKSTGILLSVLFAISLLLVGCGSKEEAATPTPATPAPSDSTEKKDEAAAPNYNLVEDGKFKFALSGMYKPYNFTEADGKLTGFDTEIAMEIGKRLGLEAEPVQTPWGSILQGLKAGKYDVIIGSMSITEEREKEVDFSEPYYLSQAVMFVNDKNSKNIQAKEDLAGKVVGVVTASTFKDAALELVGADGKVMEYESDVIALQELKKEGRVDAVITDLGVGMDAILKNKLPAIAVGEPLFVDRVGIPVQEGNKELLDAVNKALADMIADGTYLEISKKWFDKDMLSTTN